jgi:hypothetical protein
MNMDNYISKFEELINKAGFNLHDQGTLDMFMNNMCNAPLILCKYMDPIKPADYNTVKDKLQQVVKTQQTLDAILGGTFHSTGQNSQQAQQNWNNHQPSQNYHPGNSNQFQWQGLPHANQVINSSNAPCTMNDMVIPIDLGHTCAPNQGRGFQCGGPQGNYQNCQNNYGRYRQANIAQTNQIMPLTSSVSNAAR